MLVDDPKGKQTGMPLPKAKVPKEWTPPKVITQVCLNLIYLALLTNFEFEVINDVECFCRY